MIIYRGSFTIISAVKCIKETLWFASSCLLSLDSILVNLLIEVRC